MSTLKILILLSFTTLLLAFAAKFTRESELVAIEDDK